MVRRSAPAAGYYKAFVNPFAYQALLHTHGVENDNHPLKILDQGGPGRAQPLLETILEFTGCPRGDSLRHMRSALVLRADLAASGEW